MPETPKGVGLVEKGEKKIDLKVGQGMGLSGRRGLPWKGEGFWEMTPIFQKFLEICSRIQGVIFLKERTM